MAPRTWSDYDIAKVESMLRIGKTAPQIWAEMPNRTFDAIKNAIARASTHYDAARIHEYRNMLGDRAFKKAMIAAVNQGLERARFGVVKTQDCDDFRPTHFTPEFAGPSLIGSSANACADWA